MIHVVIYSRPGCHLCDEMKAIVERVARSMPIGPEGPVTIEEIDISADERLEQMYGIEIPVLLVNGKKAAKYRVTEAELQKILAGRLG